MTTSMALHAPGPCIHQDPCCHDAPTSTVHVIIITSLFTLPNPPTPPQYTFSVEMVPICKDDLICLPRKLFQASGGVGPIVLCTRVTNVLTLLCPATLQATQLNAEQYW